MFCSLQVTFSVLIILLTSELFHYCSADEPVMPQPAAVPVPAPGFPGSGPPQFGQFGIPPEVASRVMEQMQNMNLGQQMPRLTQPLIQAMRNVILSIEQLQSAMGVLENAPVPSP